MRRQITAAAPIGASIGWLAGVSMLAATEWGPLLGVFAGYLLGWVVAHSGREHSIFAHRRGILRGH